MNSKTIALYLHANKEMNWDVGKKAGLTGDALRTFLFAGDEHEIIYVVNMTTGAATAISIDGRKIESVK